MTSLRRVGAAAAAVALVIAAAAAVQLVRPPVQVTSSIDPEVTIECAATTGVDAERCLAWGDALIGGDPPSFTFEMDSLSRLRLDRAWFGLSPACQASYSISRYAESAYTREVTCAQAG